MKTEITMESSHKNALYDLIQGDTRLNKKPLSFDEALNEQANCIRDYGYMPKISEVKEVVLKAGDKVNFYYNGYGPKWIFKATGEVVKVNSKSITVDLSYGNEKLRYNIHESALTKI